MDKISSELYKKFKACECCNVSSINRDLVVKSFKSIYTAMFLNFYKTSYKEEDVYFELNEAKNLMYKSFKDFNIDLKDKIDEFFNKIPSIKDSLDLDLKAIYEGDPASNSFAEIVLTSLPFYAIAAYRIGHELYNLDFKFTARVLGEYAHSKSGIDINSGAKIGKSFFIDHGTGIVIGETTIIGNNVKIYQGVTLGALSLKEGRALKNTKRHPTIEDNVTIYSNTSILGGDTIIGANSVIGSNAFIVNSVPKNSTVMVKRNDIQIKTK